MNITVHGRKGPPSRGIVNPRVPPTPTRAQARALELEQCGRELAAVLEKYDATLRVTRQETIGPHGAPVISYIIDPASR